MEIPPIHRIENYWASGKMTFRILVRHRNPRQNASESPEVVAMNHVVNDGPSVQKAKRGVDHHIEESVLRRGAAGHTVKQGQQTTKELSLVDT